ncbi:MAG: dTMP kinase [Aquabacterium sp.]|uniref:dTMP kinase n=1 Tax=Aquabacterium sp. TaxID=1872578 RepID=UPI003BCD537F
MSTGRFISFEGIDGAGKTTHIDALERLWREAGHEVVRTREPGGTDLAEKLRGLFLHDAMDPLTEALLVFAGRRDHIKQVIEPALARGAWVLCDRFTDATFAYQGGGRGFDLQVLTQLEDWVQSGLQPDLTLLFDLPPQVAAARLTQARQPDRFEAQDLNFFERVRAGYRQRMEADPGRFVVIAADQTQTEVAHDIAQALKARDLA